MAPYAGYYAQAYSGAQYAQNNPQPAPPEQPDASQLIQAYVQQSINQSGLLDMMDAGPLSPYKWEDDALWWMSGTWLPDGNSFFQHW